MTNTVLEFRYLTLSQGIHRLELKHMRGVIHCAHFANNSRLRRSSSYNAGAGTISWLLVMRCLYVKVALMYNMQILYHVHSDDE